MPQPDDRKAPKYRNIVRHPKTAKPKETKIEEPPPDDWRERRRNLMEQHAAETIREIGGYRTPLETGD
jgi:hypothetical protein